MSRLRPPGWNVDKGQVSQEELKTIIEEPLKREARRESQAVHLIALR